MNPLVADKSVMRQSHLPGLLRSVAYNQARGVKNIQLYEIGRVFYGRQKRKKAQGAQVRRRRSGRRRARCGLEPAVRCPSHFFYGKGVVENLMRELAHPEGRFKALSAQEAPPFAAGPRRRGAVRRHGARLGRRDPSRGGDAYGVEAPVVAFELDVASARQARRPARDYVDVPTFPAVHSTRPSWSTRT